MYRICWNNHVWSYPWNLQIMHESILLYFLGDIFDQNVCRRMSFWQDYNPNNFLGDIMVRDWIYHKGGKIPITSPNLWAEVWMNVHKLRWHFTSTCLHLNTKYGLSNPEGHIGHNHLGTISSKIDLRFKWL